MFDPERLLGKLLVSGLGGKRGLLRGGATSGAKGKLGMGLFGIAIAAYEHFSQQRTQEMATPPSPPSAPLPPGAARSPIAQPASVSPPPAPPLPAQPRSIPEPTTASSSAPISPPTSPPPPIPSRAAKSELSRGDQALWLIRAMIAAAAADGESDATERSKIVDSATNSGMSTEDISVLLNELNAPRSILELSAIGTTPEMCQQLYAAALLAITVDTEAETPFMDRLASALHLSAADIENTHQQIGG